MNAERFEELLTLLIDDDLDGGELTEFEQMLKAHPELAEQVRNELTFSSFLEQSASAESDEDTFMASWATRVKATQSEEAFMNDLLPRLQEVDREEMERKIIAFPGRTIAAWGTAAAAAVALLAMVPAFIHEPVQPVATVAAARDVVWESTTEGGSIEWEAGSSVMRGTPMRIREGIVRLDLADGSQVTIEGPADVTFDSPTYGEMKHGKLLASGSNLTILTPGGNVKVERGVMGLRTVGDGSIEAAVLSEAGQGNLGTSSLFPHQTLVSQTSGVDFVPFDIAPYQSTLSVMSGVTRHSNAVSVSLPGQSLPRAVARDDRGGILVVLEDGDIRSSQPFKVDVLPGASLDLADAAVEVDAAEGARSYLIQLAALQGQAPEGNGEFISEYITFEKPILGVAAAPATLNAGDDLTGFDMDSYMTAAVGAELRGLEPEDTILIREDGHTLDLRMKAGQRQSLAQMRVFVAR